MKVRLSAFFLVLFFGLAMFFLIGRGVPLRGVPSEVPSLPEREVPSAVEVYAQTVSGNPVETSYEVGYKQGYRALLVQMGQDVPPVERYVSIDSGELDEESASRGYVDGYHKASESLVCPRCSY